MDVPWYAGHGGCLVVRLMGAIEVFFGLYNKAVYHANELIKFLTDGMIRFMDKRYLTWENDIFTVKDLIAYMKGRVSKDIFHALRKDSYSIKYRSARLETPVYLLDEELLDSIIKRSYSLVT